MQTVPEFVNYWAEELLGPCANIQKLQGGINNRVYRVSKGAHNFIIKGYPELKAGQRDRMLAEQAFLKYAGIVAPKYVPKLISADCQRRCVVLEYIDGKPYKNAGQLSKFELQEAANFLVLLNKDLELARSHIKLCAADGYLSIREHVLHVQERVDSLQISILPEKFRERARLILGALKESWFKVREAAESAIEKSKIPDQISEHHCRVSPSDFGFHNAIKMQSPVFIDFEFAGWDDPQKTIADIFLQPRVPPDADFLSCFEPIYGPMACDDKQLYRFSLLFSILKIKWLTIILSMMNPSRLPELLSLVEPGEIENLFEQRLITATTYAKKEHKIGLH